MFPAALIAFSATLCANESWYTNIEKAAEVAAKEKKAVLVEFTGSDWCGPCMALKANVFDSPEFKELADPSLVLVELDYPRKRKMDDAQKKYNEEQKNKFSISGFPTVFLLDDKGNVFWKRVGGGQKEAYLEALKKGLENKDAVLAALTVGEDVTGLEKAKILATGYRAMTEDLQKANTKIQDQIIALDPEDSLGIAKQKKETELNEAQMQQFYKYMREKVSPLAMENKFEEGVASLEKYLETPDITPRTKQLVYFTMGNFYMRAVKMDEAVKMLEKSRELSPEGRYAETAKALINNIKNDREKMEAEMQKLLDGSSQAIRATKIKAAGS